MESCTSRKQQQQQQNNNNNNNNNNKTFWYKARPYKQSRKVTYCIESVHRETHGAPFFKGCTRDVIKVTAELCRLAVLGQRSPVSLSDCHNRRRPWRRRGARPRDRSVSPLLALALAVLLLLLLLLPHTSRSILDSAVPTRAVVWCSTGPGGGVG